MVLLRGYGDQPTKLEVFEAKNFRGLTLGVGNLWPLRALTAAGQESRDMNEFHGEYPC